MAIESEILRDAERKIKQFDSDGLHYNLVASQIYEKRFAPNTDPFGFDFGKYIIAGLISFDMRMMGKKPYRTEGDLFGSRLATKLANIRLTLEGVMNLSITQIDLQRFKDSIAEAYERLSESGVKALNQVKDNHFHVGATKILHFLNPQLFIIIDRNAAEAYRLAHRIEFRKKPQTQPGYSASRYLKCMKCAQRDILSYGLEQLQALDKTTPIARIYDKLTFITGSGIE